MRSVLTAALAVTGAFALPSAASAYEIKGLAHTYMTYQTTPEVAAARTSAYNGVGTLFVQTQSTVGAGSGFICTGSLVNSTTVLTAAHCVFPFTEAGAADPLVSIRFYLPSFGDRAASTTEIYNASSYAFNAGYDTADHTGDIGSGFDVALFTLGQAATGHDTYGLYTGDPLKQYTEVGTGTIGNATGTGSVATDFLKRTGTNLYEYYGDDIFSDVSHGVALYDFDDGTAAHDVFGRNCAFIESNPANCKNQTGIAGESSASPGDSGGPEFINGQIASVTSFGITGGIFDGFCGGTSTDPYNSSRTTAVASLGNCTNSSVGEIGGNTLVSYNLNFINGYLNGTIQRTALGVPETATWAQMMLGFGLLGATLRRRKVTFAVA